MPNGRHYGYVIPAQPRTLACEECGRKPEAAERGWRAYVTVDEDEPVEAVLYCPDCARREFGDRVAD